MAAPAERTAHASPARPWARNLRATSMAQARTGVILAPPGFTRGRTDTGGFAMPELIKEFEYHVNISGTDDVGMGPSGRRIVVAGVGGEVAGDRVKGTIVGAGGDWLRIGEDGFARLDARNTVQTVDGARIYIETCGILELTSAIMEILAGGDAPTQFGEQYFVTTPRMETGDDRYAWVNQTVFVGEGRLVPGPRVEFRLFRVAG
jgi:uncharacterized protein DUF3237